MSDQKLHAIIPYFNHTNARVSRRNLELCLRHLSITPDCHVVLVEGIWNREAELPDWSYRIFRHLKFDLQSPIWVKENLINLGIKSLGEEWEYAAWIDKDIQFLNPAWAQETMLKLEQCDLLQPWSRLLLLDEFYEVLDDYENVTGSEFGMLHETKDIKGGKSFCQKRDEGGVGGFPGYSWAISKSCFKKTGGFFDLCIVGGGDAIIPLHFDKSSYREYMVLLKGLHERYLASFSRIKLGSMSGTIIHYDHGSLGQRKYRERYSVYNECNFDPITDLSYADNGTLVLKNPALQEAILDYFYSREEHLVP